MNRSSAEQSIKQSREHGAASILDHSVVPTREQLIAACVSAQSGSERARRDVINMTSLLAHKRAQSLYLAWCTKLPESCSYDDVFQAAIEGILYALGRYEAERGNAFTTVAELWIRQRVQRCIYSHVTSWRVSKEVLTNNLDPDHYLHTKNNLSLEWEVGEQGGQLHETIDSDDHSIENIEAELCVEEINQRLAIIDPRLPRIIEMYAQQDAWHDEIGEHYGISRARVGQLIDEAAGQLGWLAVFNSKPVNLVG